MLWTNLLNSYRRYDGAFSILTLPDGTCLVCGYSQVYQTPDAAMDNFLVLKVDGSGRTLSTQSWGGPDNDNLRAMISVSDQTVILFGHRDAVSWPLEQTSGPANWYLIKAQWMVDSGP